MFTSFLMQLNGRHRVEVEEGVEGVGQDAKAGAVLFGCPRF